MVVHHHGDGCGYLLDIKHSGYSGFVVSLVGTIGVLVNLVLTCIFIFWRFPRLTSRQTRAMMSQTRRILFILFICLLIPFDFFAFHAWRILPGDIGCVPKADWAMVWICASGINSINLLVACLNKSYTLAMIYVNSVSYVLCVYYYMFSAISDNNVCGTMFVALPTIVVGTINLYMLPRYLTIEFEQDPTHTTLYDQTLERLGTITESPSDDNTGHSVYLSPQVLKNMSSSKAPNIINHRRHHRHVNINEEYNDRVMDMSLSDDVPPFDIDYYRYDGDDDDDDDEPKTPRMYEWIMAKPPPPALSPSHSRQKKDKQHISSGSYIPMKEIIRVPPETSSIYHEEQSKKEQGRGRYKYGPTVSIEAISQYEDEDEDNNTEERGEEQGGEEEETEYNTSLSSESQQ